MRFSVISTALAFVLSVNGATLNKRDVTTATQTCLDDLNAVNTQLTGGSTSSLSAFTTAGGYAAALTAQSQESTLETKIKTAVTDCCAITNTVSDEDSLALLSAISTVVDSSLATMDLMISKKTDFDNLALSINIARVDLANLHGNTTLVSNCIVATTPSAELATAQGYADQLESAFQNVIAIYAVNATTSDVSTDTVADVVNVVAGELAA